METITFKAPAPQLTLDIVETRQAGRCYTVTTYKVRSTKKLPRTVFDGMREAGLLGYGQGFSVSSPDEEEELMVPISKDADTGKVYLEGYEAVLNPYTRQPYKPQYRTVYVYTVTSECDSGD